MYISDPLEGSRFSFHDGGWRRKLDSILIPSGLKMVKSSNKNWSYSFLQLWPSAKFCCACLLSNVPVTSYTLSASKLPRETTAWKIPNLGLTGFFINWKEVGDFSFNMCETHSHVWGSEKYMQPPIFHSHSEKRE